MDEPSDVTSEIRSWWKDVYERTKRESFLNEADLLYLVDILPLSVFNRILRVLNLEAPAKSATSSATSDDVSDSVRSLMGSDIVNAPPSMPDTKQLNPYVGFFKRPAEQVKAWRPADAKSTVTTSLNKVADNLARSIAEEFVAWFKSLGGAVKTTITVDALMEMFEIGSQQIGARCLRVEVKEQASVPETLARSFGRPERSRRLALLREVERDARAARRRPRVAAFGAGLAGGARQEPPSMDLHEGWKKQVLQRKSLRDMSAVWEGITHLKSTRGYCEFLLKAHPEVEPPQYLVESGLFKKTDNSSLSYLG